MKNLFIFLSLFLIGNAAGQDWHSRWDQSGSSWSEKWENTINNIQTFSREEQIEILGSAVRSGVTGKQNEEQNVVFKKAWPLLMSIPGHAKYYQDKIESLRAEVISNSKKTEEELQTMQDYDIDILGTEDYGSYSGGIAFPTLSHMPSTETVAVLGRFLNDPEGRDGKNVLGKPVVRNDASPPTVNAQAATLAIRNLGIEHPPFRRSGWASDTTVEDGEIDVWKEWWNEVAAGKRTYRFTGSPVEYGPDGPVSKEKLERIRLSEKRDDERKTGKFDKGGETETSRPTAGMRTFPWMAILASTLLCGGAVWYFMKVRKRA